MAPAPSPNACGLAAYRQLAGNLRIDDIQHGYWTSRKGNAARFMMWYERRRHAAPWLESIAGNHGETARPHLLAAAESFEAEANLLGELSALLPVGGDEKAHWEEANMAKAEKLLARAETLYRQGIRALEQVAAVDNSALETKDADKLQKLVTGDNYLASLAALDALVKLAPKDLDRRLAELFASEPDARKELADGPIHRQLIFALDKLDSEVATEAIGKAVFFPGESDAVKPAISKWAAEMYWERKGKDSLTLFMMALDSEIPHVAEHGLKYVGMSGNEEMLPRVMRFDTPAGWHARILLGDDTAYPKLFAGLTTPGWWPCYSRLRELGARVEPHAIPYLTHENPQMTHYVAILLSRVGTDASIGPIEAAIAKYPAAGRLQQALADLKQRLETE